MTASDVIHAGMAEDAAALVLADLWQHLRAEGYPDNVIEKALEVAAPIVMVSVRAALQKRAEHVVQLLCSPAWGPTDADGASLPH